MPNFDDLLGGPKAYTEDDIRESFMDIFMTGIETLRERIDFDDEDVVAVEQWYADGKVDKIIAMTREKLTEQEFNHFVAWQRSDLAKKAVLIQEEVQKYLLPSFHMFMLAREERKDRKRAENAKEFQNVLEDKEKMDEWEV